MPRTIASLPARAEATAASDLSSCGFVDVLSSGFASGGIGLGHPGLVARKRSLDNLENIPPFGLNGSAPMAAPGADKSAVSLLDFAAQQLSQNQHKRRRAVITASSPGSQQRLANNPCRMTQPLDGSFLRSLPGARSDRGEGGRIPPQAPNSMALLSSQLQQNLHSHLTPQSQTGRCAGPLRHSISGGGAAASVAGAASTRLRRLPKRNLKPLDFSSLHQPSTHHSARPAPTAGATAAAATAGLTAASKSVIHSSGVAMACASKQSLPVSPAQSSPVAILPVDGLRMPTSSPSVALSRGDSVATDASSSVHPTPPSTEPRRQSAFSGLLASAYERASIKRSSKRALCFDGGVKSEDEFLQECDSVLGPRCPVIGVPGGLFEQQKTGIDSLRREQNERTDSMFSEMTRTVQQAQREFEAAVAEQKTRGRPPGAKQKLSSAAGKGKGTATKQRPISECKYCGKQYKYHAKLASHEQHCSSRLEALLYSADEHEQHVIHCLCGPRHDRPVGKRDDLPMVQCDNCLLWLHIECVGIDEDNLPEEYFCPRCEDAFDDRCSDGGKGGSACPSTPKRRSAPSAASHMMSPESSRLATLLAGVPDAETDTDEEPIVHKPRGRPRQTTLRRKKATGDAEHSSDLGSEDTMSISNMSEAARFHRRGGGSAKRCKSPVAPRMAQSEVGVSPSRRRRVRSGVDGGGQTVHTDALSSDFLGLPLPETIFSEKPGVGPSALVGGSSLTIAPTLCSQQQQQQSMDDLARFFSTSQPQWSLAQLSNMLGGSASGAGAGDMMGGVNSSYLDMALADLGLGLGAAGSAAGPVSGIAAEAARAGSGSVQTGFDAAAAPLSELVDLPIDNEFSALLDSFASGNAGTDADPYSSLGVGSNYGGLLSDDIMLELNSCMPISGPIGGTAAVASNGGAGARLIGTRRTGEIEHGSSSTITLMHDSNSLCSQDSIEALAAGARVPRAVPPAPARPPPGMPGMMRGRSAGITARGSSRSSTGQAPHMGPMLPHSDGHLAAKSLGPPALSAAMSLSMSSNPPSTTGLGELDMRQLLLGAGSSQMLDWPAEGDALERELEGLINFDA